ncbi:MAG: TIGR00730 family Rossman fold protein [Acidobacteriaceae bacterium]|nr:TIGR00730 family Rossman fold protein [Acidobacteriaceae bacterium]
MDPHNSSAKSIAVFCASASGTNPTYLETARDLGRRIAERNYGVVYGGASVGTMGALADAALAAGGKVIGVIPGVIIDLEIAHNGLTELHIVKTMHERKALMAERADAFIALPGGYGTLDEFVEILTWAQLRIHAKPCIMVNVDGYYDPLLAFFDRAVEDGLIKAENRSLVRVARDASEALEIIEREWSSRAEVPAHDGKMDELVK